MKRRDLLRQLEQHGSVLDREGSRPTIYHNPQNKRAVAVPRHREIKDTTACTICDQIGVLRPE